LTGALTVGFPEGLDDFQMPAVDAATGLAERGDGLLVAIISALAQVS
jgi:hypothetical protein